MQSGVIPKTLKKERLRENFELFDFLMEEKDMLEINKLQSNTRFLKERHYMLSKGLPLYS